MRQARKAGAAPADAGEGSADARVFSGGDDGEARGAAFGGVDEQAPAPGDPIATPTGR
jgi:hypothetical protein